MKRFLASIGWLLAPVLAGGQELPGLLPQVPHSAARRAPIEALEKKGLALAAAFRPHVHRNARGETMPYRLYTPERLAPGRTYPLEIIDTLIPTLPIDKDRIYLTGHSMGGAGAWHMTRRMIDALRKAGGRPRHTEYPGVGHDVFLWAYTEPALVEWLFAQERTAAGSEPPEARPHVAVRGIYGGVPQEILDSGRSLREFGLNAVWMGSGSFTPERMALLRAQGVRLFAEFNTLHVAEYLKEHPDAAPIGPDGRVSPPPDGWQGICPSHEAYRRSRMEAFRELVREFAVDGVWLDYHHAHASWEQAVPNLPDTCFCDRCLDRFQKDTGVALSSVDTAGRSRLLLSTHRRKWVRWRCDLFTDWVRELRTILDATRPGTLLGTFHNPWSDEDLGGARIEKLAVDLKGQAAYVDVFSPMPYHARFGHAAEPEWISRQVAWLGRYLGIEGAPGEKHRIWPIVQVSDWGEAVPLEQVPAVLDHGSRRPATGVMVFAWSGLRKQPDKVEAIGRVFRAMRGTAPPDQ